MQFKVTAIVVDLTKNPVSYGPQRVEVIDTAKNEVFKDCDSLQSVEVAYEWFWNYLNSPDVVHNPREKVKVLAVERL